MYRVGGLTSYCSKIGRQNNPSGSFRVGRIEGQSTLLPNRGNRGGLCQLLAGSGGSASPISPSSGTNIPQLGQGISPAGERRPNPPGPPSRSGKGGEKP